MGLAITEMIERAKPIAMTRFRKCDYEYGPSKERTGIAKSMPQLGSLRGRLAELAERLKTNYVYEHGPVQ